MKTFARISPPPHLIPSAGDVIPKYTSLKYTAVQNHGGNVETVGIQSSEGSDMTRTTPHVVLGKATFKSLTSLSAAITHET